MIKDSGDRTESKDVFKTAIRVYGHRKQIVKAIEEFSELTKALCKWLLGIGDEDNIAEEMADCYIMLWQLRIIFKNDRNVDRWAVQKEKRLSEKLEMQDIPARLEGDNE